MANLDLIRWQLFAPDIGDNRSEKRSNADRLFLEVAVGLSQAQLDAVQEKLKLMPDGDGPESSAALATAVSQWVKLRGGPHQVGGQAVSNLAELLAALPSHMWFACTMTPLGNFNSLRGQDRLFFARSSGGSPTTSDPAGA